MSAIFASIKRFLEERGGVVSAWRHFADEPTPIRRAWFFTLGSAALLAFVIQLATGALLALSYAPTPDHAHESVKVIETQLPAGSLVRGLHHWGASAMVLLVALHLVRTFGFGAYKKPRELNWLVGVVLLILVLGFGFTGYLLPWDQKAYWATVVGTKTPSAMPVIGAATEKMLAGGPSVGAYTLTRFYALHIVLLPLLTMLLIGIHLLLLRRHGHAGPTTGPDPREPFFPYQFARDALVGLLLVTALFWLAARHPAPLERLADPSDTSYSPRPEWYFLPLFQMLKLFKGPLEPIGTAVLPGLAIGLLALVPWLDRGPERRPGKRRGILLAGSVGGLAILVLLGLGAADQPKNAPPSALGPNAEPPPEPRILGGAVAFERRACVRCHGAEGNGGAAAPEGFALVGRSDTLSEDKLATHIREMSPPAKPVADVPGENDPDKDIPSLVVYARALQQGPVPLGRLSATIRLGGAVMDREECRTCHVVFGEGGRRGPELTRLSGKRDRPWLVGHFQEPKKFVPGSKMPSFRDLPEAELAAMSDYLLAIP
ncbi:MAG: cytochrome b N-terminal domain-containing protein [Thermoanaerobaculia bacterium]